MSTNSTQCMVAGSVTTIAVLKGTQGIPWLSSLNVPHAWVDTEGNQGGSLPLPDSSPVPVCGDDA